MKGCLWTFIVIQQPDNATSTRPLDNNNNATAPAVCAVLLFRLSMQFPFMKYLNCFRIVHLTRQRMPLRYSSNYHLGRHRIWIGIFICRGMTFGFCVYFQAKQQRYELEEAHYQRNATESLSTGNCNCGRATRI